MPVGFCLLQPPLPLSFVYTYFYGDQLVHTALDMAGDR